VQTFEPEHPAIQAAVTHDYVSFAQVELKAREEFGYPPAHRMLALRFDGPDAAVVAACAARVAEACRAVMGEGARLRGPAEAPIPRIRGRCRFQLWLSAPERGPLAAAARAALSLRLGGDVRMAVDFDPQSVL
jgi:primosomal protein N' (replication factor Y)